MTIVLALIALAGYLGAGALLFILVDGHPRTEKFIDHVTPMMQLPMLLLWPLSLPALVVRHARHR